MVTRFSAVQCDTLTLVATGTITYRDGEKKQYHLYSADNAEYVLTTSGPIMADESEPFGHSAFIQNEQTVGLENRILFCIAKVTETIGDNSARTDLARAIFDFVCRGSIGRVFAVKSRRGIVIELDFNTTGVLA